MSLLFRVYTKTGSGITKQPSMKKQEKNPSIVLMTDFGLDDPYVGIMKGIIADIAPKCPIIDLTHGIRPQNILQGSFLLSVSFRQFPKGTIFLCVIDPGVGTLRRPVLVKARDAFFIGPDNGLFGFLNADPRKKIIHLTNTTFFRHPVSHTFHGRDIFAPVAAHLAHLGPRILRELGETRDTLLDVKGRLPEETADGIAGTVVHIDRFGNLITNIPASRLTPLMDAEPGKTRITFRDRGLLLVKTFAEAPPHEPCALIGSTSHLEIFVRNENAQEILKAEIGEKVYVNKNNG